MGLQFLRPQLPTAGLHGGGSDTEQESEHKVKPGEENSLAAPAGIRTRNLSIRSPALLLASYPTCCQLPGGITGRKTPWLSFECIKFTKQKGAEVIKIQSQTLTI